ncbi:transcriptional regulator, TetR family [Burkholderia sp. GAS332]|nr:transcriptional regulator, TetR family [Burkholderia sp. GAS332]
MKPENEMNEVGLRGQVVRNPDQRDEQRRQILAAAGRVFARKGYATATMDDIAAEMGVTKGVLYYQFRSKQEVIVETRRQASGSAADRLEEIVGHSLPVPVRMEQALRDLISTNFDEATRHIILTPLSIGVDEEHYAEVRSIERRYERLLMGLLKEGIADGSFVDAHVKLTCFTLIRACTSPASWYSPSRDLTEKDVTDGLTAQLMRSITSDGGASPSQPK